MKFAPLPLQESCWDNAGLQLGLTEAEVSGALLCSGIKLGELEAAFAELDGWSAESDACELLNNLGVDEANHYLLMKDIPNNQKVKVLLAQALFGNP